MAKKATSASIIRDLKAKFGTPTDVYEIERMYSRSYSYLNRGEYKTDHSDWSDDAVHDAMNRLWGKLGYWGMVISAIRNECDGSARIR